jgi:hypothetical protein
VWGDTVTRIKAVAPVVEEHPQAAKLAAGLGLLAVMGGVGLFGVSGPGMTGVETALEIGLMAAGAFACWFVARRHPLWGTLAVPAALFVLSGLGMYLLVSVRSAWVVALRPRLPEYLALQALAGERHRPGRPALRRKLVIVDEDRRDFDDLHFQLPGELRAGTPAEVGTVIQVRRKQVDLGKNPSGGTDYRRDWTLRVFDNASPPRFLFEKEFPGDLPYRGRGDRYGELPVGEVRKFLLSACGP